MSLDGWADVPCVVIDTNWVLDLCVFHDPRAQALRAALEAGQVRWLMCPAMTTEWERVLDYPALQRRWARDPQARATAQSWLATHAQRVPTALACGVACRDPDDQMFLNLAAAHRATLLSKDHHVLACRKRLATLGVLVSSAWPTAAIK